MRPPTSEPELLPGDIAASEGHWAEAVESWNRAAPLSPKLRRLATNRIDWFLSHDPGARRASPLAASVHLLLLSLAAAVMATALVLLPETPGSTTSNIAAVGAWLLIALSAGTAIVAARRSGVDHTASRADQSDRVAEARHLAVNLDSPHVKSDPDE